MDESSDISPEEKNMTCQTEPRFSICIAIFTPGAVQRISNKIRRIGASVERARIESHGSARTSTVY
jgi:hypothetical protein